MRSYTLVSVAVAMGQHQPNWHLPPVRQERYHNEDRINLNRSRAAIRAILSEGGTAFFNPLLTSRALRTARSRSSLPASNQDFANRGNFRAEAPQRIGSGLHWRLQANTASGCDLAACEVI